MAGGAFSSLPHSTEQFRQAGFRTNQPRNEHAGTTVAIRTNPITIPSSPTPTPVSSGRFRGRPPSTYFTTIDKPRGPKPLVKAVQFRAFFYKCTYKSDTSGYTVKRGDVRYYDPPKFLGSTESTLRCDYWAVRWSEGAKEPRSWKADIAMWQFIAESSTLRGISEIELEYDAWSTRYLATTRPVAGEQLVPVSSNQMDNERLEEALRCFKSGKKGYTIYMIVEEYNNEIYDDEPRPRPIDRVIPDSDDEDEDEDEDEDGDEDGDEDEDKEPQRTPQPIELDSSSEDADADADKAEEEGTNQEEGELVGHSINNLRLAGYQAEDNAGDQGGEQPELQSNSTGVAERPETPGEAGSIHLPPRSRNGRFKKRVRAAVASANSLKQPVKKRNTQSS